MSTFPIYKQSKTSGVIVKFVSQTMGEVVDPGHSRYSRGHTTNGWASCTNNDVWKDCSGEYLKENVKSFKQSIESLALFQTINIDNSFKPSTLTKVPDGYVMTSHSGHQIFIKETTKEIILH